MKLSIVTINYNNRGGLQRTLNSIISQTNSNFEWIVIDGGSSDGSKELILQHQDAISYWCSEPDKGIYHAMNKGVDKSHGDYLLFLNSGDVLCHENVIRDLVGCSFSADVVSCDIYVDGYSQTKLRKSVDNINAYWIYDNSLYHQSTWIRRDILIRYPYHEEFKSISDWVFFFEAFVLSQCSYQHVPMAISVFFRDGMSCDPRFLNEAYADKYRYLKTHFPARYVDEKEVPESFHYISATIGRMSRLSQLLIVFCFKTIAYMDLKIIKPMSHLMQTLNLKWKK